ncbi:MAG: electron transfer flavoprotein subunit beta [Planctomycetes bacterium]|nr:electron transfer flavoprotein subunit beta [Planctomycetota bacterium]
MNAICCIARVPDTATRIKIGPNGKSIDPEGVQYVINPFDEFALEAAIQHKEAKGGELVVMYVGQDDFAKDLRQCLAKGADKAIHLKIDGPLGPQGISSLLAEKIRPLMPASVFCGKQAVDGDVGGMGVMLAGLLDVPAVSKVSSLELKDDTAVATREIEGGVETIDASLPCVFTFEKGANEPRRAGLKEIMAAKKKPLEVEEVSAPAPKLSVESLELPPPRPEGRIVGEGTEAVAELVLLLREESKVI